VDPWSWSAPGSVDAGGRAPHHARPGSFGRADLLEFERSDVHRTARERLGDLLTPSTLAVWTCRADQLPIGWDDVRARITAIDAKVPDRPDRRATDS